MGQMGKGEEKRRAKRTRMMMEPKEVTPPLQT